MDSTAGVDPTPLNHVTSRKILGSIKTFAAFGDIREIIERNAY
jgi:hypothetical protein